MMTRILLLCGLIACSCNTTRQVETKLYFGQSRLDGGVVSEKEWNEFVAVYISRVFPAGSTVENANGNWYDTAQQRLITEPSKVVTAINRRSARLDQQIDSLRYWYRALHKQQSVLRVDRRVKARLF